MGRKAARRRLKYSDEVYKLKIRGIVHSLHHKKDLDEASGAYKDIDTVMKNQQNLVKIKVKLTPLGVIKG
jgi:tRNA-splicing ligase RtcB